MRTAKLESCVTACAAYACSGSNAGFVDAYCIGVYTYQTLHACTRVLRRGSAATFWEVRGTNLLEGLTIRYSHAGLITCNAHMKSNSRGRERKTFRKTRSGQKDVSETVPDAPMSV